MSACMACRSKNAIQKSCLATLCIPAIRFSFKHRPITNGAIPYLNFMIQLTWPILEQRPGNEED